MSLKRHLAEYFIWYSIGRRVKMSCFIARAHNVHFKGDRYILSGAISLDRDWLSEILFTSFEGSKEIYLMPGCRGGLRSKLPDTSVDYVCKNAFLGTTCGLYAAEVTNKISNYRSQLTCIPRALCRVGVAIFDQNSRYKKRETVKNRCFTKLLMQDQGFGF